MVYKSGRQYLAVIPTTCSSHLTILVRQIKVSSLFTDYRIQSNANNQITLMLSSEALLAALRSADQQGVNPSLSNVELVMKCVLEKFAI